MGFPLRFTADLQLGVVSRVMRARRRNPLILNLAPYSEANATPLPEVRSTELIVWVGGSEPLEYPEIPRFVNALAAAGREVLLRTDGVLLRRRIHEFQPSSRFRFVFPFESTALADNRVALEAVRAVKLSGFLVCALTVLRATEEIDALAKLHAQLHGLDLDGYLISPAANTPSLARALGEARRRLLNRRWSRLSEMLDSAVSISSVPVHRAARTHGYVAPQLAESTRGDCEEGAQA
jgi:hypothetical protein